MECTVEIVLLLLACASSTSTTTGLGIKCVEVTPPLRRLSVLDWTPTKLPHLLDIAF